MPGRYLGCLVAEHARQQVLEEQALEELGTTPCSDLLEGVLQVALHGVLGDEERPRDLAGGVAAGHEPHDLRFPGAEAVGGDVQPGYVLGPGWLYDDYRLTGVTVPGLGEGAVEREPTARASPYSHPRDEVRILV